MFAGTSSANLEREGGDMSLLRKEEQPEAQAEQETPGPQPGEVEKVPPPPLVTVGSPHDESEEGQAAEQTGEQHEPREGI
jgi:hypothetical protein